jgi:hypothetical protein
MLLCVRVCLKCDGTRWRTGGEVKGKLANGVGSQYSHTTSELGVSSITTADANTSAASSRLNWRTRRFKWTRPFPRKTKSGFCACAITFQKQVYVMRTYPTLLLLLQLWPLSAISKLRERQQWLRESSSMLCFTYGALPFFCKIPNSFNFNTAFCQLVRLLSSFEK